VVILYNEYINLIYNAIIKRKNNYTGVIIVQFGEYLKNLRRKKHISLELLADLLNNRISMFEIALLETNRRKVYDATILELIAPHLGVSYIDILIKAIINDKIVINTDISLNFDYESSLLE